MMATSAPAAVSFEIAQRPDHRGPVEIVDSRDRIETGVLERGLHQLDIIGRVVQLRCGLVFLVADQKRDALCRLRGAGVKRDDAECQYEDRQPAMEMTLEHVFPLRACAACRLSCTHAACAHTIPVSPGILLPARFA